MRSLALIALVPIAAQAQVAPADMVEMGLRKLTLTTKAKVELTGSEVRGNSRIDVKVTAGIVFRPDANQLTLEILSYEDGKLTSRQAADGSMLWNYDVRTNTFTSADYANESVLYKDWPSRLFRTLRLRTTGATAFVVRILDDAFGTGLASGRWQPWIPTAKVAREENTVVCSASNPGPNWTTYYLDGSDEEGYDLTGISYLQDNNAATVKRWDATITKDTLTSDYDCRFIPPRSARAVATETRSGG